MSLLATQQDFEPANDVEGAAALYWDKANNESYKNFPYFQWRIDDLKGRFAPNNQKLAIWGCGWGYMVQIAVQEGYDAYGFDASAYAINRGKQLIPTIANRLFQRSALVAADVTASKNDAGIHGNNRFALLVTEDMLTCMSDAEIATTIPLLRGICNANLLHIVSPQNLNAQQDPRINWKTIAQWEALLSPPDVVYDAIANSVMQGRWG